MGCVTLVLDFCGQAYPDMPRTWFLHVQIYTVLFYLGKFPYVNFNFIVSIVSLDKNSLHQ